MSKFDKLLIFLEGLVVGGIGGHLLTKYPILHSPSKILDGKASKKTINDICDEQKSYEKEKAEKISDDPYGLKFAENELVNKNRKYIEYKDEKKDDNDVDLKNVSEEFDEPSDRVSIDNDSLPRATYGPAFISKEDLKKIVEGDLHLVTESEISGVDMEKRQTIKKIKGLDFLKAVEMNSAFEWIEFDPKDKSFSYVNTGEVIPYEDACRKFTKSIVEDIFNESSYNADGWIQPLNLYDSETNFYTVIETKKYDNDVDPKNVSEEFDERAFVYKEDVKKIVKGELHLVTESKIFGKNMMIQKIKELDFLKAIESESLFECITFDPSDKSFSYTNTNEKIPYKEACRKFTKSIVEDILNESSYNADGWIQPLNLYDRENNIYIFIETKKD